ncbi:MAG: hypothetical protein KDD45_12090 [Bdellovibrionales bacterium]|nr:hypothetical protein [Bdellovibrionales bacterium]
MKKIIFLLALTSSQILLANTIYQCAVENVVPHGARVNILENKGKFRANLIFGTTVSGTMYSVEPSQFGYKGSIKGQPGFSIEIYVSSTRAKNSNIEGFAAKLNAVYPTLQNAAGFNKVSTPIVCGKKISNRWQ